MMPQGAMHGPLDLNARSASQAPVMIPVSQAGSHHLPASRGDRNGRSDGGMIPTPVLPPTNGAMMGAANGNSASSMDSMRRLGAARGGDGSWEQMGATMIPVRFRSSRPLAGWWGPTMGPL